MLSELRIKNFGIIEEISWSPQCGFNVITGETGAGKSMIMDAIEALLEGRLEEDRIRYGADASHIEAVFSLQDENTISHLKALFADRDIEFDDNNLVISCIFRRQGRVTLRINGSAVTRTFLKDIAGSLVDIHGQSQHLSLFNSRSHIDYLDRYVGLQEKKHNFRQRVQELYRLEQENNELAARQQQREHRREMLSYQIDEIKHANLQDDEDIRLESRKTVISAAEKLKSLAFEAYAALNGEDDSGGAALLNLNSALKALRRLCSIDAALLPQTESLAAAVSNVEEAAREIFSYKEKLHYDPDEMDEIEGRLELLRSLKKKYGAGISQIRDYLAQSEKELESLSALEQEKLKKDREILALKQILGKTAGELSEARQSAAARLAAAVQKELDELNMSGVTFKVSLQREAAASGIPLPDGQCYRFSGDGIDNVEFMVSTNPGEPEKPLASIASTGEVSRFTLALKVALARADRTPVLIFDEIDIGVGGRSGEVIGKKLWVLGRQHQVICITHLPQIAAWADTQFKVYKEVTGERMLSSIQRLDAEMRLHEIASMLGGVKYGEAALDNARDILDKARLWIKNKSSGMPRKGEQNAI